LEISGKIQRLFTEISPLLPQKSYIVDFAVLPTDGRVIVVELNPFHANTHGCLFGWGRDRDIIFNGNSSDNVEFRIVEKAPENPLEFMPIADMVTEYYERESCILL